jgi:hypothetical protein
LIGLGKGGFVVEQLPFGEMKKIPSEMIADRIASIKELKHDELEQYEVVKDQDTGDHYLHYSYLHRNIADTGELEVYHQLLPLESDDVLGLIFGEQAYSYPDHWNKPFLRNGPDGFYIWFDPAYDEERLENEAIGQKLIEQLKQFKQSGSLDEEAVRKLLNDLDDTVK